MRKLIKRAATFGLSFVMAFPLAVCNAGAAETLTPELPWVNINVVDENGKEVVSDVLGKVSFKLVDSNNKVWAEWDSTSLTYEKDKNNSANCVYDASSSSKVEENYLLDSRVFGSTDKCSFNSISYKTDPTSYSYFAIVYDQACGKVFDAKASFKAGKSYIISAGYYGSVGNTKITLPAKTVRVSDPSGTLYTELAQSSKSKGKISVTKTAKDITSISAGNYQVYASTTGYNGGSSGYVVVSDTKKDYHLVTLNMGLMFPEYFNSKGEIKVDESIVEKLKLPKAYYPVGKNSTTTSAGKVTLDSWAIIESGAYIQRVYPDANGNVSFYLCDETRQCTLTTDFTYSTPKLLGSGGGCSGTDYTHIIQVEKTFATHPTTLKPGLNLVKLPVGTYRIIQTSAKLGNSKSEDVTFTVKQGEADKTINVTNRSYRLYEYGDVNRDGIVDVLDAVLVKQYIAKINVSIDTNLADVNHDGSIDVTDAVLIMQNIARINQA